MPLSNAHTHAQSNPARLRVCQKNRSRTETKNEKKNEEKNKQSLIEIFQRTAMIFFVLATFRCRLSARSAKYGSKFSFINMC